MAESLKDLLVSFNGSSEYAEAIASTERGKVYVPTDADVIVIDKRRVACGSVATTEADGLMSATDKEAFENTKISIDNLERAVGRTIPNTYATKEELEGKIAATDAMVLAGTISGTGVIQKHNDSVVTQDVKDNTTNISALTNYSAGWTWRVSSNGTIPGIGKVESGDMVMCISDYKNAYSASDWTAIQRNIDLATEDAAGLMSSTDKSKLNGIESGAQKNQNAFGNVVVKKSDNTSVTLVADAVTDTLSIAEGEGIELAGEAQGDGVTIKTKKATADTLGGIKVSSVNSTAVTVNSESTTAGRYYPVELNADGKAIVNVPWTDTDTNTDTKVKQTAPVTTAADYQVLISKSANTTEETNTVQKSGMTYNPNTKKLTGPTQVGDVTLANVVTSANYTNKIGVATDSKAGLMSADQRNALVALQTGLEEANVDIAALVKALTWE